MNEKFEPKRIIDVAWVLPRPRKDKYVGGFPLHFETKLYREIGIDPVTDRILHPFGGRAERGIRLDLNMEVEPNVVGDAHFLPFKDGIFDCLVLDPPYNDKYAKKLYGTKNPKFSKYIAEAERVTKDGGFIVVYHWVASPAVIPKLIMVERIFMETRVWHKLRCIHIYKKFVERWERSKEDIGFGFLSV